MGCTHPTIVLCRARGTAARTPSCSLCTEAFSSSLLVGWCDDVIRRGDAYMNAFQPALATVPWFPIIGNHESSDGDHFKHYEAIAYSEAFGVDPNTPFPGPTAAIRSTVGDNSAPSPHPPVSCAPLPLNVCVCATSGKALVGGGLSEHLHHPCALLRERMVDRWTSTTGTTGTRAQSPSTRS